MPAKKWIDKFRSYEDRDFAKTMKDKEKPTHFGGSLDIDLNLWESNQLVILFNKYFYN